MNVADLVRLLEYRVWARDRTLAVVEGLPAADFTKPLAGSFPCVRDTLVHILSADFVWASRIGGVSPTAHLNPGDFPDIQPLRARWAEIDQNLRLAIAGPPTADPDKTVVYKTFAGVEYRQPLAQIIQHLVNHQTYHLGQVTTMLHQLHATPVAIDMSVCWRDEDRS